MLVNPENFHDEENAELEEPSSYIARSKRLKLLRLLIPDQEGQFEYPSLQKKFMEQLAKVLEQHGVIGEDINISLPTIKIEEHFENFKIIQENESTYTISAIVPYRLKSAIINISHGDNIKSTRLKWSESEEEKREMFIPIIIQVPKGSFNKQDIKIIDNDYEIQEQTDSNIDDNVNRDAFIARAQVKLQNSPMLEQQFKHFSPQEIVDVLTITETIQKKITQLSKDYKMVEKNNIEIEKLKQQFLSKEISLQDLSGYSSYLKEQESYYHKDINDFIKHTQDYIKKFGSIMRYEEIKEQFSQISIIQKAYEQQNLFPAESFDLNNLQSTQHSEKIINEKPIDSLKILPTNILKRFIDLNSKDLITIFGQDITKIQSNLKHVFYILTIQKNIINRLEVTTQALLIMRNVLTSYNWRP